MKKFLISIVIIQISIIGKLYSQPTPFVEFLFNVNQKEAKLSNIETEFNNITYTDDRYGKPASAGKFNGNNSYIKVNYNINPSNLPQLSMVAWTKPDMAQRSMALFSHDNGDFDRTAGIDNGDGETKWAALAKKVYRTQKVIAKEWTFFAVVYNQKTNELLVNINGETSKWSATVGEGNNHFYIGATTWDGGSGYFSGLIDDIRFYNQALSEEEILEIYNKEKEGVQVSNEYLQYYHTTESPNADILVRVGDVDNLGFLFPDGFDPFCGRNTNVHSFPWATNLKDLMGTDRIMVGSSFKNSSVKDGYASQTERPDNNPVPIVIEYPKPQIDVNNVVIQMFVDDFQSPDMNSFFQVSIDGKRLLYLERIINSLRQTGPIGKMVTMGILSEDFPLFTDGKVEILIDDPLTGVGDGFAIDFVQVLLNTKGEYSCIGNIKGVVKDKSGKLLEGVSVSANNIKDVLSNNDGTFLLSEIPNGIIVVSGQKQGYTSENVSIDLKRDETATVELILKEKDEESVDYIYNELKKKGRVDLYGIRFDVNKNVPKASSEPTLIALYQMLSSKPELVINIVGHTDSDGDDNYNLDLSVRRAISVLEWLKQKGISPDRLKAEGLGEMSPVVSNGTATGKELNRRVEIRID